MSAIEEVRRKYRENPASWGRNRGFSRCKFCDKYSCGQWCIPRSDKSICDQCLTGQSAEAGAQAPAAGTCAPGAGVCAAVSGEIIQIPYLTVQDKDKKSVKVTVEVRRNWDDGNDFELVHESKIWKMGNPYNRVQRRSYFVKKNKHVTIGIQNLESAALILKILHVDENLDPGDMKTVTIQPHDVYKFMLERADGEDRESLKIFDSSDQLSLMLSVQEELPDMSRKRLRGEGSAATPIEFDDESELDMSLRTLSLLGQAL
jgi:hypothetical protein